MIKKIIEDFKKKYPDDIDEKRYLKTKEDNLLEGIDLSLFESDYKKGIGNELDKKFMAVHSSAALVVNNFAILKKLSTMFISMSYPELWSLWENDNLMKEHLLKIKKRYLISL